MRREHRTQHVEIRATPDTEGLFEAVVMRYGVKDDYRTIFDAGCFTESLEERMPRITWGHDWTDVIGLYVDYTDTDETLTLVGQLSDFDAVPRARQAYAQLLDGTIDNFSVGFRIDDKYEDDDEVTHFRRATLDETALVLAGAVPGTSLVGVRTIPILGREIPEETVISLAKQVAAGDLTKEEAQIAIDLAAGEPPSQGAGSGDGGDSAKPAADGVASDIDPAVTAADDLLGIG